MKQSIELLAPGGDIESIKAAIAAGADAIYCGLNKFNARDRATNIDFDDLHGIIRLAHRHRCRVFLTLNIVVVESELPALLRLLNRLVNTKIDGVIVQDLGVFYLVSRYFKSLKIHASTQVNTHNEGQIRFLNDLSVSRVNLARELNIREIKALARVGHDHGIKTEVFVHGSYCLSFSGLCYFSSVLNGRSGNRGRCSQPCRDRYEATALGNHFPLNLKDNSAYSDLEALADAGVDSLKIEGRIKKCDYVYTVVECWKKQIRRLCDRGVLRDESRDLYKVFNRDFSNAFLTGDINKGMFIDNPRDHSIHRLSGKSDRATVERMDGEREKYYDDKAEISETVSRKIERLSIAKVPLHLTVSGEQGAPLSVSARTPDGEFCVRSETPLSVNGGKGAAKQLTLAVFQEKFNSFNDSEYAIAEIDLTHLQRGVTISYKELTALKKRLAFILNGSKETVEPVELPGLKRRSPLPDPPTLSVLISDRKDVPLCTQSPATTFFQLPSCFDGDADKYVDLFLDNKQLLPWFPAVLIGENYAAAVDLLHRVRPRLLVTDNTGIAHEASKGGIPWVAGPHLNVVNSFSLLCLKERFACCGAFVSNEISKSQIKGLKAPENFDLYYSICHPISLLTSRQCLHHQVVGCEKDCIDRACLITCEKSSSVTHLNNVPLLIKKTKGNYHCVYNAVDFLNTGIVTDLPGLFSSFLIDLREIHTATTRNVDKGRLISLFDALLRGDSAAEGEIRRAVFPTTNASYNKGI